MCNFEPWKTSLTIKDIYPIGSIIFSTQPLGNKIVWELPSNGPYELTVEWEGMTWELINETPTSFLSNPQSVGASITKPHSIRNVWVWYQRNAIGNPWTATLFSDEASSFEDPLPNISKFTGENAHQLLPEELPSHKHNVWLYNDGSNPSQHSESRPRVVYGYWSTLYSQVGFGETSETGGNEAHNNKEKAYNCFMYRRIQ